MTRIMRINTDFKKHNKSGVAFKNSFESVQSVASVFYQRQLVLNSQRAIIA